MGKFNDILDALGNVTDGAYPETMLDDLLSAYDSDVAEATGPLVAELEAANLANAELNTTIAALKQHNYDLLVSQPSTAPVVDPAEGDGPEGEDLDITIDDLFEDKE